MRTWKTRAHDAAAACTSTVVYFSQRHILGRCRIDTLPNFSVATRQAVSKDRVASCPQGWKESINGKNWELTTWFRVTCWRKLAEAVNQYAGKGLQVFVEGELRGEPVDGAQNPRIWTGNDGEHRASYEVTARTVKFLGKREGSGGAPATEPPPEGYEDDDALPF